MTMEVITMPEEVEVQPVWHLPPWFELDKRAKNIVDVHERNAIDQVTGPEVDDETYAETVAEIRVRFREVRNRWTRLARSVMRGAGNRPQFDWSSACADILQKTDDASHYIVMQYYNFCGEIDFD